MPLDITLGAEHLAGFKTKLIAHPHLVQARKEVIRLIEEPAGASLAAVIGPTGAGKSTLLDGVRKVVLERRTAAMITDTSLIPIVSVEAPAPEQASFNWKDLYLRILVALKEPACEWQLALKEKQPGKPGVTRLASLSLTELRARVEAAFLHRGVKVLLIDEAQHLRKLAGGRHAHDQMDTLKSLASLSKAFVVLFGTYELIPMLELNGQLARRCVMVHCPRYRHDDPAQWQSFQAAVRSLGQAIMLPTPTDLVPHSEYLYRSTAGCIGILKGLLTTGYARALEEGHESLTLATLEASKLPNSALEKITEEIVVGEAHWVRSHAPNSRLDELLGLACAINGSGVVHAPIPPVARQTVGIRNPTRDPVGITAAPA